MFEDVRYGLDGGVFARVIIEEDRWKLGNPTFMISGDLAEEVLLYSLIEKFDGSLSFGIVGRVMRDLSTMFGNDLLELMNKGVE